MGGECDHQEGGEQWSHRKISNLCQIIGEDELLIKSTGNKKESIKKSSSKEKEEEGELCGKETKASPQLITNPPTILPPTSVIAKSREQEREVMGKKIESIDETPEITEEGGNDGNEAKQEELKADLKKAQPTIGNGAKKNLKHFTFSKEDMEFKPPKKPGTKGGETPMISLRISDFTFFALFINLLVFTNVGASLPHNSPASYLQTGAAANTQLLK